MSTNRPDEAETMLLDVLEAFTVLQGDQGEDVLNSLDGLGAVSMTLRKYSEAMDFYQKCLEGFSDVLGKRHLRTLHAMNGLAGALWCEKQFAEATALRKESLQFFR